MGLFRANAREEIGVFMPDQRFLNQFVILYGDRVPN